jgi:hypothetical protein
MAAPDGCCLRVQLLAMQAVDGNPADADTAKPPMSLAPSCHAYWASEYGSFPTTVAWYFATDIGMENFGAKTGSLFAVAVRTGDVAAVPEPKAFLMLTLGLGGLMLAVRRRPV